MEKWIEFGLDGILTLYAHGLEDGLGIILLVLTMMLMVVIVVAVVGLEDDEEDELRGSASSRRHTDRGSLRHSIHQVANALNLDRGDFNAADVHGVVATTQRTIVLERSARGQRSPQHGLDLVAVSTQNLTLRTQRHVQVVAVVMITVQETCRQTQRWRDESNFTLESLGT